MQCPLCNVDLMMSERQGVEIDYCPKCRGIWLDRGELDKIIEKVDSRENNQNYSEDKTRYNKEPRDYQEKHYEEKYHKDNHYQQPYKKKRGGFLGDLLDFGGD